MLWSASHGLQPPIHEERDREAANQSRGKFERSNSGGSAGAPPQPTNRELTHAAEKWSQFNAEKDREKEIDRERERSDNRHRSERSRKDSDMSAASSRRSEDREVVEVKTILSHPPVRFHDCIL